MTGDSGIRVFWKFGGGLLYRHSEIFRTLLVVVDMLLVAAAWLGAYWLRFHTGLPAPLGVPEFQAYLPPLLLILPLWHGLFRARGLYEPQRTESLLREAWQVIRATAVGVVLIVAVTFFARSYFYSRGVIAIFSVLAPTAVFGLRLTLRLGLRQLRRQGYNLRFALIVGGGAVAEEIIDGIHAHPEAGLRALGVLAPGAAGELGRGVPRVPVLGDYGILKQVLARERVDQLIIALPREDSGQLEKVLADLDDEVVDVKLVPDLLHVMTLRSSVETLDGLPIINLREGPLLGWAAVQKRVFDLAVCIPALTLGLPVFGLIGAAVWLTSGWPILYVQERMGLDGRVFRMIKFRSMRADAEKDGIVAWTAADDPRRTRLGRWLRRFSLDELPQLWNVLRGDMSLVGPRPERPALIEEFRREIPGYMLRHKVKAGMTGWAQVHGWRGDTSLHERVEHDIYYIQNWSPGLDVRIVLSTLGHVLLGRNAH